MTTTVAQPTHIASLAELARDTPEIIIDLGVVRANINRAASSAKAAGMNLRPHTKTHKLPQFAQLQVAAGAVGIQVAKVGEAELMVEAGIQDVLVGYPVVGEVKLARLVALAKRARISVTIDSLAVARGISAAAAEAGIVIPLLIEVDTGLRRLGVQPGQTGVELAEPVAALPAVRLAGVF